MFDFKLKYPKGRLRHFRNMSVGEMKTITQQELAEYVRFWKSEMEPAIEADLAKASSLLRDLSDKMAEVFGDNSKQHKYILRKNHPVETIPTLYYSQFVEPEKIAKTLEMLDHYTDDSTHPLIKQ